MKGMPVKRNKPAGNMDEAQERLDKRAAMQMSTTKQGNGSLIPSKQAMQAMQKRGMSVKGKATKPMKKKPKNLAAHTRSLRKALSY